jgi:hypothetical protein
MTLTEIIDRQHQLNEQAIAARIAAPRLDVDSEGQNLLGNFVKWAKENGVRYLPAAPSSVAVYLRSQYTQGATAETILKTVEAIDAWHVNQNLGSPTATPAVRAILEEILHIDGPRSWSKQERLLFAALPIEIRAIIQRRVQLDSNAVRKAQHDRAAAVQELEQLKLKQKGIENGTSNQERP